MRGGTIVLVIGAALVVGACGGDDEDSSDGKISADEQPYVDALRTSILSEGLLDVELDEEEAACVSAQYIDVIGVDELAAANFSPHNISQLQDRLPDLDLASDEAGDLYDSFGGCGLAMDALLIGQLAGGDADAQDMDCLSEQVGEAEVRSLFITGVVSGAEATDELQRFLGEVFGAMDECGVVPD